MSQEQFLRMLTAEDFPMPTLIVREPEGFLDDHTHPFEVKALVIDGEIDLVIEGVRLTYRTGDIFHLTFNQVHNERYGKKGVQYLASRKEYA